MSAYLPQGYYLLAMELTFFALSKKVDKTFIIAGGEKTFSGRTPEEAAKAIISLMGEKNVNAMRYEFYS